MNFDVQAVSMPGLDKTSSAETLPDSPVAVEKLSAGVGSGWRNASLATGSGCSSPKAPGCRHRSTGCEHAADALSTTVCCQRTAVTCCLSTICVRSLRAIDNSSAGITTTTELIHLEKAEDQ
jgi:hypothetical protein